MRLTVVGPPFRDAVCRLRGKRLGCFCDEADPCHAKVLAELAEEFAAEAATVGEKRKREEAADEEGPDRTTCRSRKC